MITVLHRERSKKLARRFAEICHEQDDIFALWPDLSAEKQEIGIRAFDALIQDGLIGEHQPRPEGRE